MKIELLIPTRGRPDNVWRLLRSVCATRAKPELVTAHLWIDDDDEATLSIEPELSKAGVHVHVGPRGTLTDAYNKLAEKSSGSILFSGADDIVFRTPGWDEQVRAQFAEDPFCLVYGDDCLQHEKLCTHPFVSRRAVEALGYFYPDTGGVNVTDVWLFLIYRELRRLRYLPNVVIEHLHFLRGLAEYDETYKQQYEGNFPKVMATLARFRPKLVADIQKLRQAIGRSY